MSEYIVNVSDEESEQFIARFGIDGTTLFGHQLIGEIVRCRDCEYFDTRKCKSQWPFCLDAFCWWGKPKEDVE